LIDKSRIEQNVELLLNLRKTPSDLTREQAYKMLIRSDAGKVLLIDIIEKYLKTLSNLQGMQDNDSNFFETKGQLIFIDWLLNTVKEEV